MDPSARLDATDRRIVALLSADCRLTFQQVGDAVGLSAPAAYQRVKKLERDRVVRGYHADVDPVALGRRLVAFLEIDAEREDEAVEQLLAGWHRGGEALECHRLVSGRFLTKVRVPDVARLEELLDAARARGVRATAQLGVRTLFEHRASAAGG
ncbi:MAG: Lrp/AsnC family transcriptional regulator [Gemmatimonadales bacterium]|jgi:Lrp/AsnC family leucine-responsive transcriptional regulator